MRTQRTFLSIGLVALLTACGTTQSSTSENQNTNRGRSNTEITGIRNATTNTGQATRTTRATTNTRQATTEIEGATPSNRNTVALEEARMQKMYSSLNMNSDQIKRFESEWEAFVNSRNSTNRNQAMNNFERTENQDRILKEILDGAQFKKYQQWAKDNAVAE